MKVASFGLFCFAITAFASPGDKLDEFRECTDACEYQRRCAQSRISSTDFSSNVFRGIEFGETPVVLKWGLFWDCVADCDYQCQQVITRERIAYGEEIFQFHGKWPFIRLLGMQELFSVIFSIGNFLPHYYGLKKLQNRLSKLQHRGNVDLKPGVLLRNYMMVAMAGMFAWTASSVFHLRDLMITEKLDYFFAGGTVLSGFHAIFSRIARLDKHPRLARVFTWSVISIFALHILRLYVDWSYTYNMRFNVFYGLLQYFLLLLLAYRNYTTLKGQQKSKSKSHAGHVKLISQLCIMPIILVVATASAMSLEIFDFFDYGWQIDAHALWHLCTIWPSWALYDFFIADFNFITKEATD